MSGTPQAANRVYDGTLTTTISGAALIGVLGHDSISLAGLFANKNVGTNKTVTLALTGTAAGNYSITQPVGLVASITRRALVIVATGVNKVYDGLRNATVIYGDNRISGDALVISGTALFSNQNAGTGKTISVNNITLTGADALNYTFNNTATTLANILRRALTITAANKTMLFRGVTPALTYNVAGLGLASTDNPTNVFTGKLATATGVNATRRTHPITQGTLTTNANYIISLFINGVLTVL
jgi:hypothetical protein